MADTFHKVGPQEYKVDHECKKIFRKQHLSKHTPEHELVAHPDGFTWLDTGGDYQQFCRSYSAPESATPEIQGVTASKVSLESFKADPEEPTVELPSLSTVLGNKKK